MSAWNQFAKSAGGPIGVAIALIGVGATLYFVFGGRLKRGLQAAGEAVNPTSDKNLAYRGVNAVGAAVTGDDSFSLGSWFYDLTHREYDPNADMPKRTPTFVPRSNAVKAEAAAYEQLVSRGGYY